MTKSEVAKVSVRLKVPFHDLDPMGIVWHGNYLKYFEIARDALFERRGFDIYKYCVANDYVLPIIRITVKHVHPLRLADEFTCEAVLVEARNKLVVDYEIRLCEKDKLVAKARTEQAAVTVKDEKLELRIPEEIAKEIGMEE